MKKFKPGEKVYLVTNDMTGIQGIVKTVKGNTMTLKNAEIVLDLDAIVTAYKNNGTVVINRDIEFSDMSLEKLKEQENAKY